MSNPSLTFYIWTLHSFGWQGSIKCNCFSGGKRKLISNYRLSLFTGPFLNDFWTAVCQKILPPTKNYFPFCLRLWMVFLCETVNLDWLKDYLRKSWDIGWDPSTAEKNIGNQSAAGCMKQCVCFNSCILKQIEREKGNET